MIFRQDDFEIGTSRVVDHFDGATVQLGRPARDGQAKTGAARLGAGTRLAFSENTNGNTSFFFRTSDTLFTVAVQQILPDDGRIHGKPGKTLKRYAL